MTRSSRHARRPHTLTARALLLVLVLLISVLPAQPAAAQEPTLPPDEAALRAAAATAVEHWIGTGVVAGHFEDGHEFSGTWLEPSVVDGSSTTAYDLYVDAAGKISGVLKVRWSATTHLQPQAVHDCMPAVAENAYHGYNCTISQEPGSGSFTFAVTGTRTRRDDGSVEFKLEATEDVIRVWRTMTGIQFYEGYLWSHRAPGRAALLFPPGKGMQFRGMPVSTYGKVLVEDRQVLDYRYDDETWGEGTFEISLFEVGLDPTLDLDVELLERSVFMDQVPVPDALTANTSWQTVEGGKTDWRLPAGPESTPLSKETVIKKTVDVGSIGVGEHPVTVKGTDSLNRATPEELVKVVVAEYFLRCPSYTTTKQGGVVTYKCEVKVPKDEPFEARIAKVWDIIPYFGGKPLGLGKVQFGAALELKSTGEGSVQGDGSMLFDVMGGQSGGKMTIKGDLLLKPDGVYFTGGSMSINIVVQAERKEGLLKAIPALTGPLAALRGIAPDVADYLEKTAEVKLALGGSLGPTFPLVRDPDPGVGWKFGQTTVDAGLNFDVEAALELWSDVVEAKAKVGGGVTFTFNVPKNPDYLKQVELKFVASFTGVVLEWETTAENAWVFTYPGGAVAAGMEGDITAAAIAAGPVFTSTTGWVLRDRSYLTQPGYHQWVGTQENGVAVRGDLVHRINPQARPAFVDYGSYQQWLLWSYERPDNAGAGINATNSDEIAFANLGSDAAQRPPNGFTLMTTDNRSDLNPQVAYVSNFPMVVWERMETHAPGDFPANPEAYLSHLQVAASPFTPTLASPTLQPVQISPSGSLNHRPQVVERLYLPEQFLAVWVNNPANKLRGSATHPDRFMYSLYNRTTKTWTPAQAITGTIPGIQSFDLISWRDTTLPRTMLGTTLLFMADRDGNPATRNDTEIYYTEYRTQLTVPPTFFGWSPITQLTNNSVDERDVQVEVVTDLVAALPTYVTTFRAGSTLYALSNTGVSPTWSGAPQALATLPDEAGPITLARHKTKPELVAAWSQPGGFASVRLLANAGWTKPRTVETPGRTPADLTVAYAYDPDNDVGTGPVVFAQLETSNGITRTLGGVQYPNVPVVVQRDLAALPDPTRPASPTIVGESVQVLAGSPLRVTATVANRGDEAAENMALRIVARQPNTVAVVLAETQPFTLPNNTQQPLTLTVGSAVAGDALLEIALVKVGCSFSCGNTFVQIPADAVAAMGGPTTYVPRATTALLYVGQTGPLLHAATLDVVVRKGRGGPVIATVGARLPVQAGAVVSVTAPISPAVLGPGEHILEWEIVSDGAVRDPNPANNTTTSLAHVLPDLFMEPYLTKVEGNTVRARVENRGNWPSVATVLEVWSGVPGTSGAAKLGSVAVPPLATGAHADLSGAVVVAAEADAAGARYLLLDPANLVAEIDENSNLIAIAGAPAPPPTGQFKVLLPIVAK
jgi:hypothetical protein